MVVRGASDEIVGVFSAIEPVVISTTASSVGCLYTFSGDLPDDQIAWQFIVTDGLELDPDLIPLVVKPDEVTAAMAQPDGFILVPSPQRKQ